MLIKNIYKNMKILKKNKNMIRGIGLHYFSAEVKTKIDVIRRGCFNLIAAYNDHIIMGWWKWKHVGWELLAKAPMEPV